MRSLRDGGFAEQLEKMARDVAGTTESGNTLWNERKRDGAKEWLEEKAKPLMERCGRELADIRLRAEKSLKKVWYQLPPLAK